MCAPLQRTEFYQWYVRTTLAKKLGIRIDKDFIGHEGADNEQIRAFNDAQGGAGPDLEDLHFDLHGGLLSYWNQEIFRLLLDFMREEKQDNLPSDEYIQQVLHHRYKKLMIEWAEGQAKITVDGTAEDSDEVETRILEKEQCSRKKKRQNTRRANVSTKYFGKAALIYLRRGTSGGALSWTERSIC